MSRRGWECLGCGEHVRTFLESLAHCDPNEIDTDDDNPTIIRGDD